MEKREIPFRTSMNIDKRNQDFAYLRNGLFASRTPGMYPAIKFRENSPTDSFPASSVIHATIDSLIIIQDGSDVKIYYSTNAPQGTYTLASTLAGHTFKDVASGNNGVHLLTRSGANAKVNSVSSVGAVTEIASITETFSQGSIVFDGLYYFYVIGTKIYKQLKADPHSLAFNDTGDEPRIVDVYDDQIALFFDEGLQIKVALWDKSDTDLFDDTIRIPNSRLVAGGTVDGVLMLVKSVGNRTNIKERNGELVITGFDGQKFVRLNSIVAGNNQVLSKGQAIGSEVLVVALSSNDSTTNTKLHNNFILKIHNDGAVEAIHKLDLADDLTSLDIHYDYITFGLRTGTKYHHNADLNAGFNSYINYDNVEYISNFLDDPTGRYKLDGVGFLFEKIHEDEELDVYFRASDREAFTLLDTITPTKLKDNVDHRMSSTDKDTEFSDDDVPSTHQIYTITKMSNGDPLPEFNEAQFDLISRNGFSVIDAWYYRTAITRNMM